MPRKWRRRCPDRMKQQDIFPFAFNALDCQDVLTKASIADMVKLEENMTSQPVWAVPPDLLKTAEEILAEDEPWTSQYLNTSVDV